MRARLSLPPSRLRLRLPAVSAEQAGALATLAELHRVELRVLSVTPWLILVADDRAADAVRRTLEGLEHSVAAILGFTHLEVRRLTDIPEGRRASAWANAIPLRGAGAWRAAP